MKYTLALALLCGSVLAQSPADVKAAFNDAGIVDDLINEFNPTTQLLVYFGDIQVVAGDEFDEASTQTIPTFQIADPVEGQSYIITMVDPDAGENADVRHYLGANYTADNNGTLTTTVQAISPYFGPAPPENTGLHRYSILVFLQPSDWTDDTLQSVSALQWNFKSYIEDNNLTAIAGEYFRCQAQGGNITHSPPNTLSRSSSASSSVSSASSSASASASSASSSASASASSVSASASSQSASGSVSPSASSTNAPSSASASQMSCSFLALAFMGAFAYYL